MPSAPLTRAIVSSCSLPTPTAQSYGSSQNGINGIGGEKERPSAAKPSLETAAASGALEEMLSRRRLPTPCASDCKRSLSQAERGRTEGVTLHEAVAKLARRGQLPTPTAQDRGASGATQTRSATRHTGVTLTDVVVRGLEVATRAQTSLLGPESDSQPSSPTAATDGDGIVRLNPAFVEWMMGFPIGMTDLTGSTPSATPSSATPPPTPSPSSGTDSSER